MGANPLTVLYASHTSARWTRRCARVAFAVVVCAVLGCRTLESNGSGPQTENLATAPYRLAIAPVQFYPPDQAQRDQAPRNKAPGASDSADDSSKKPNPLRFLLDAEGLRTQLIESLVARDATSVIVPVGSSDLIDANTLNADLLLKVRLVEAKPRHSGLSGPGSAVSALLWIGTWAGGLLVPDSRYETGLTLECSLVNPHHGETVREFPLQSEPVNLAFWERNPIASVGLLQSLILPPFWTSDDPERTSEALTKKATRQIAEQIAQLLAEEASKPREGTPIRIEILEPANGGITGGLTRLRVAVHSEASIDDVVVQVNGEPRPSSGFIQTGLQRADVSELVRLQPGRNELQVQIQQGGATSSQTIVVHTDDSAAFGELTDDLPDMTEIEPSGFDSRDRGN